MSRNQFPVCQQGDVLLVDFHSRVGDELTGPHYAITMHHSDASNSTVVVVPLTSYKAKNPRLDELNLGSILWWTQKDSIAKVGQVVCIAKERIVKFSGCVGKRNLIMSVLTLNSA